MSQSEPLDPLAPLGAGKDVVASMNRLSARVDAMNDTLERLIRVIDGEEKTDNPGLRATVRKHETLYQTVDRLEFTMRIGGALLGLIGLGNLIDLVLRVIAQAQVK